MLHVCYCDTEKKFIYDYYDTSQSLELKEDIPSLENTGKWQDNLWPDDWTAVTIDGKRSAQFEHTIVVTETGCEILTARRDKDGRPHFLDQLQKLEGKGGQQA